MLRAFVLLWCMSLAAPISAATIISFAPWSGDLPAGTVVIETFEDEAVGSALGPRAFVYDRNVRGQSARPAFGSTGKFGAVWTNGSYNKDFAPTRLFAFVLGSLDTYNRLTLRYEDQSQLVLAGGQIINGASFPSGNQLSGLTNGVVSYKVTSGPRLTGATFSSSGNSFEFDNLATAPVPEPATWALMIGGFGLVGFGLRRRARSEGLASA
jgi:hypothetical protein